MCGDCRTKQPTGREFSTFSRPSPGAKTFCARTRLAHGLSNEVIADRLGIKAGSVDFHVQNIFRKLGVNNRTAAATKGLIGGYIEL